MVEYVAYIDEAGDEGFGKLATLNAGGQSRWLVIGACIVRHEDDLKLPGLRNQIVTRLGRRQTKEVHFRDLKHAQKIVACQEIARFPISVCVTFSHKITIAGTPYEPTFKRPGYLYNYLVRWLLERVTAFCATQGDFRDPCKLRLVFSRRANTNYQSMKNYLELMRDGLEQVRPVRSINWRVLNVNDIAVENHSKWAGLQVADCVTSAFFQAVEPNAYGNYETAYAEHFRAQVIRSGTSALNSGVSPVPSFMKCKPDEHQRAFFKSFAK